MADYRSDPMAALARQMRYTPAVRRRAQLEAAERLYWKLEPERSYPASFIVYRITGYRADAADELEGVMLVGEAVRLDLLTLVAEVSEAADETPDAYDPPPLTVEQVARELGVTVRSVNRYARRGLFARKLIYPTPKGPRKKLAFLRPSIDRFVEARGAAADEAARFARIDEPTRHAILTRARRLAGRTDASARRVAAHLARKYGRSTDAVRRLLRRHDERDPRFAIFPLVRPTLSARQRRVVHRALQRGVGAGWLAQRFDKSPEAVHRAALARAASALRDAAAHHVHSPTFDREDAALVILAQDNPAYDWLTPALAWAAAAPDRAAPGPATPGPGFPASRESALFARMNFHRCRAGRRAAALDRYQPAASAVELIAADLRLAASVRRRLAWSYLPVVAAVARQHLGLAAAPAPARRTPRRRSADAALERCILAGGAELLAAIDRFDAGRARDFAASLRWSLMRWFAAHRPSGSRDPRDADPDALDAEPLPAPLQPPAVRRVWTMTDPLRDLAPEAGLVVWGAFAAPADALPWWRDTVDQLDPQSRTVLCDHLGLPGPDGAPRPARRLDRVADAMGLEPERARRLERQALRELRRRAALRAAPS